MKLRLLWRVEAEQQIWLPLESKYESQFWCRSNHIPTSPLLRARNRKWLVDLAWPVGGGTVLHVLDDRDVLSLINTVKHAPLSAEAGLWNPANRSRNGLPTRFGASSSGPVMNSTAATATSFGSSSEIARRAGRVKPSTYGSAFTAHVQPAMRG
jgi:hypothetical protein